MSNPLLDQDKLTPAAGRSLQILLLYDCIYPESLGGVEHRNYHLARSLARRGHRVTLAGWCRPTSPLPGVQVLPMRFPTPLYNRAGKRSALTSLKFAAAAASLKLAEYDVIETASIPYVHLLPLALRCYLAKKPLIVTWIEYWGSYWRDYKGLTAPLFMGVEWGCAQLGTVNAISHLTAQRVQANRLSPDDVKVIPCGVSLEKIRAAIAPATGPVPPLIYAGRLMREKRVELLLEAVQLIDSEEALLTIVGDGPDRQRLETLAQQLGIGHRVVFLGRLPDIDDVWRQLSQARIAVQPSSREGFGMFPLEAMAVGIPVIYCRSTENAISGLVRHNREGVCCEAHPETLARTIQTLLNNSQEWTRLSQNARARAQSYDWDSIAQQIEALFEQAVNQ
ncbi:MAG: glycosyltransferase family 4 protein [Cyanophyceae cyanobacterium]